MKIECLILCVENKNSIFNKKNSKKILFFQFSKSKPMPDQQRFLHFLKREAEDPIR